MNAQEAVLEMNAVREALVSTPMVPIESLPATWQDMYYARGDVTLSDDARYLYVEAATLFMHHETPFAQEAMQALAQDFHREAYPDLSLHQGDQTLRGRTYAALRALFAIFGYDVPASFYNVIIGAMDEDTPEVGMPLFVDEANLMRDRLWDAVLHAALLVTPVGVKMQSVLSEHGVMIIHLMKCRCKIKDWPHNPIHVPLDETLKAFYLQNMIAASLEQYGVNAHTSGAARGY